MNKEQKQFKRLENGLLEGTEYVYLDDGRIDWRSMIKQEFLAVQSDKKEDVEKRYGKKVKDINLHDVEDYNLIILLGGIKDLLRMRGFKSVKQEVNSVSEREVVCTCTIEFIPNFETNGEPFIFSDVASASVHSVSGVFQLHLAAIAANRAFVRCVRNALGVNIAGKDEFDINANKAFLTKNATAQIEAPDNSGFAPSNILQNKCKDLGISFDKLKERSITLKGELKLNSDPSTWTDFSSIEHLDAYTLISRISSDSEKKAKK